MLRVCSLLVLLATPALAGPLTGTARIIDGDTLGLATPGGEAIIRLHGIDAPERGQSCADAAGDEAQNKSLVRETHKAIKAVTEGVEGFRFNSAIAKLYAFVATVKAHVSKIFAKLDCTNRVQIAIIAHEAGLTGIDQPPL